MSLPSTPALEAALVLASAEHGLQDYYYDCVRPLLGTRRKPRCCGRGCEPCAETLIAVKERVHQLLGLTDAALIDG